MPINKRMDKEDVVLCVCIYVYIYIYIYIYVCVYIYVCIYIYVCVCVQWNYLAIKLLNLAIYNKMMDPEDFMLSKIRQMENDKYHMISLHVEYKKQTSNTKKMNKSNQRHRYSEQSSG